MDPHQADVLATKEQPLTPRDSLQASSDEFRAEIRRSFELLRQDFDRHFRRLYWIMGIGFTGNAAIMVAILVRLYS